jgi:fructokinase
VSEQILVIGEALTDCVYDHTGALLTEVPGGSPMNVAIGLGRLGHDVLLAARFGADSRGRDIAAHVEASRVHVIPTASGLAKTPSATARLAADGSAQYEFDLLWDLSKDMVPEGAYRHVHTGSIGATLQPGATAVAEIVAQQRSRGASISYDPNARPQIMGEPSDVRAQMEALIALSDVVKASDEDIEWLYPGLTTEQVIKNWQALGAGIVLITLGSGGVLGRSGVASVNLPSHATSVVDTIGAGDSFMAGLLSALVDAGLMGAHNDEKRRNLDQEQLAGLVSFALSCAAVTVSRAGANPPTRAELHTGS